MSKQQVALAHELDAAWIIALWKAIHGGDPSPEVVAAQAIAALSQYLAPQAEQSFAFQDLERKFGALGIKVTQEHPGNEEVRAFRPTQYCFHFKGQIICTPLPKAFPPPPQQ